MKHLNLVATAATLALGVAAVPAHAAQVDVKWQEPSGYSDLRTVNENTGRFQARVMNELEETFRKSARYLPEGQTLQVTVTDVDLAGEIEYFHENYPFGIRVIRRVDAPSMNVQYELRGADDTVLASGEATLADGSFPFNKGNLIPVDRTPLRYERAMIQEWVRENFGDGMSSS